MKLKFDYNNGKGHCEIDLSAFFPNTRSNTKKLLEVFKLSENARDLSEKTHAYLASDLEELRTKRTVARLKNDQKKAVSITMEIKNLISCAEVFGSEYGFEVLKDADADAQKMKKVDVYALRTNGSGECKIKVISGYEFKKGGYTFHTYKGKTSRVHILFPSCGLSVGNSCEIKTFKDAPEFITDKLIATLDELVKTEKYREYTENFKKFMKECGYEITGALQPIDAHGLDATENEKNDKIVRFDELKKKKEEQRKMEKIKNLSQFKKAVSNGLIFRIVKHGMHEEFTGQIRQVNVVQTNAFYSVEYRKPDSKVSKWNDGKGAFMLYGKAKTWDFSGDTIKVYKAEDKQDFVFEIEILTEEEADIILQGNAQEEKKDVIYKYGMRLRGFSVGCQPSGVIERLDDETGKYWDIITYDRPLTTDELQAYELDDLNHMETVDTSRIKTRTETASEATEAPATDKAEEIHAEGTKTAGNATDEPQATAGASPDMFAELARAYVEGKTAPSQKKKTTTPSPVSKTDTEGTPEENFVTPSGVQKSDTEDTEPGYHGEASDILTTEEISELLDGKQVRKTDHNCKRIFISTPYTDRTSLVYTQDRYQYRGAEEVNPLTPGGDFKFCGFILDKKLYTDKTPIVEKLYKDMERKLQELIPNEDTARENAADVEKWEQERIDFTISRDWTNEARKAFYDDKLPRLKLYTDRRDANEAEVIRYIENPETVIVEHVESYKGRCSAEIYKKYIEYNRTMDAYKAVFSNPQDEAHRIKAISTSVTDQKTARIELSNGETVKADAWAIKSMSNNGKIWESHINAADRQKLPKDENGWVKDISADDIVAIYHGQRTLYRAS